MQKNYNKYSKKQSETNSRVVDATLHQHIVMLLLILC